MKYYFIKVVKTPDGPAPENFRAAWMKIRELLAHPYYAGIPKQNFLTGQLITNTKGGFFVYKSVAVGLLRRVDSDAAEYFEQNAPTEGFVFAEDEVEIIEGPFEIELPE